MIFSGVTGINIRVPQTEVQTIFPAQVQIIEKPKQQEGRPLTVEGYVRNYFADLPIMAEVARCESHFRQFDKDGQVIRGAGNKSDVGVMQINEEYHIKKAGKLGLDIYTLEGNVAYAKTLYEEQGVRPWFSSSGCWANFSQIARSEDKNHLRTEVRSFPL